MAGQAFGVIGLEVMGRNIALNIERNGFPIAVFNRTYSKTQAFLEGPAKGKNAKGAERIEDFVKLLQKPRRILLMVKAGEARVAAEAPAEGSPWDRRTDSGGASHFGKMLHNGSQYDDMQLMAQANA